MVSRLDLYHIFCVVARSESFSRAARQLYMSQPAVSQAIAQLEGELDIRLFHRTPRGVSLTPEGKLLYEHAGQAINLITVGEEKLLEFRNLTAGELKIGVGDTIARHYLLPYLEAFHNRHPNIKIRMLNGTTLEICARIKSGDVDVGLCNLPVSDPALEQIPCMEIEDVFVVGEKYRRLLSGPTSLDAIAEMPLIMLEPGSNSRKYVEDFLLSRGVKIAPEFELGSHDLLLEFARINLGVACVSKPFSRDYLDTGQLHEIALEEPIPQRHIGLCYLSHVPLSAAAMKFVELVVNG